MQVTVTNEQDMSTELTGIRVVGTVASKKRLRDVASGAEMLSVSRQAAAEAIDRLPSIQRTVLSLRDHFSMTYREIGESVGLRDGEVVKILHRARLRLCAGTGRPPIVSPMATADCRRALPLLSPHVDGCLGSHDESWLNEHLATCSSCRLNLKSIEAAVRTCRQLVL